MDTPAKSVSTLNGERLASVCATEVIGKVRLCISSVWPSGADLATASAPIAPPAPPRFSTTTGWPMLSLMRWATMRATTSVVPPAGKGTMIFSGLDGNDWAQDRWVPSPRLAPAKPREK